MVSEDEIILFSLGLDAPLDRPPGGIMNVRFPLSLGNVEDLFQERGIDVGQETVRYWWNRSGTMFAAEIRRKRIERLRACSRCR